MKERGKKGEGEAKRFFHFHLFPRSPNGVLGTYIDHYVYIGLRPNRIWGSPQKLVFLLGGGNKLLGGPLFAAEAQIMATYTESERSWASFS